MEFDTTFTVRIVTPLGDSWLTRGGVDADGTRYGAPRIATAWGLENCPLLPRAIRDELHGVEIPHQLREVLGVSLTCSQLDSEVWKCMDIDILPPVGRSSLRDFLYSLQVPSGIIAIPAGLPLMWLNALPLTKRTQNAVQRGFRKVGEDDYLIAPLLAEEFLALYSVGIISLIELLCVMESAELEGPSDEEVVAAGGAGIVPTSAVLETPNVDLAVLELIQRIKPLSNYLYTFAAWARAETDASTIGEAITKATQWCPAIKEWESIEATSLEDLADVPTHPYEILDDWIGQLSARDREIFQVRILGSKPKCTLEELGASLGITRERVRQLVGQIRKRLDTFLAQEEACTLHWRARTIRHTLGTAAPMETVEPILKAPEGCNDYRSILLELAGPYDQDNEWLILRSTRSADPTPTILLQVDEFGRIDHELASAQLREWGIDDSLHEDWLTRKGNIRLFNRQLVHWGRSVGDRMAFALADLDHPATVEEAMHHVGEDRSRNSAFNAMINDPRLVKVSRRHWALASWEMPVYSGVAHSIRNLLKESGGSMPIYDIVRHMEQGFGVVEATTRAYCEAPMFITKNGSVRLRTEEDGPYRSNPDSIRRARGVFYLGAGRVGRLFSVDKNILRGSGNMLTRAAGSILGVGVNDNLTFTNKHGDVVTITFPESSIVGPSIGSIRPIAEGLSAQTGDLLTLILDKSDMSVTAHLTDPDEYESGWELVGRLTGIAVPSGINDLASALRCSRGEVRSLLRSRGDDDVLKALPIQKSSADLDEALAALADKIQAGK